MEEYIKETDESVIYDEPLYDEELVNADKGELFVIQSCLNMGAYRGCWMTEREYLSHQVHLSGKVCGIIIDSGSCYKVVAKKW